MTKGPPTSVGSYAGFSRLKPAVQPAKAGVPILLLLLAVSAHAGELRNAAHDAKALATAPLHWRSAQWQRLGEGAAAVAALAAFDKPISRFLERNVSDSFSRVVTPFGGGRALQISGLMFAGGALLHNRRLENTGRDAVISQLWAAGLVTPLMKRIVGRARPFVGEGAHSFKPFTSKSYESFPSGHATNAFALATSIANHYGGALPAVAYSLATGVAIARVHDNVHWPSDVVAGALIGRAVAKGITFRHTHVNVTFSFTSRSARRARVSRSASPTGAFGSLPAWPR